MRLLKLGVYPAGYLRDFYQARPLLKSETYKVQHRALIADCFGSSDFWTCELNKLNYETADLIANAEFLQNAWSRENDVNSTGKNPSFVIAAAQIVKFRPDILLIADYANINAEFIRNIRARCPSIRLVLGWCGAPYQDLSNIREWDIALSCVPEMVSEFRRQNIESYHVNHAFAPRILDQINRKNPPSIDFGFIGSIERRNNFHRERERLLIELVKSTDLQIWSDIKSPTARQKRNLLVRQKAHEIIGHAKKIGVSDKILDNLPFVRRAAWENAPVAPVDERILRRTHSPVFGLEMFQTLHDSRIVFNNHIDISPVSASNMRLFEATGAGACLITDWKENLHELFAPDTEVLTYRTAAECAEKVNYLLAHEAERKAVAAAGQRRTLREHTFENRAAVIDKIIRKVLTSG